MILVCGGAGYIGSHTNKLLNRRGYQTVVFDNLGRGHREFVKWGHFVEGDLADKERLRECFRSHPIEAVMHFCAFAYVGESCTNPSEYYRNNVVNTLNLLDVMVEFGVDRFIFSSTCATYGSPEQVPIPEDHPQRPINPYGRSKLMVEQILGDYGDAYGIRHACLRYFNAAGADPDCEIGEWHEPESHLIPIALHTAAGKLENMRIFGTDYATPDGTCVRDYIHVNDLASAHIGALEYLKDGGHSDAFNLGNGKGFSVREVIQVVEKVTGMQVATVEEARRPGDPAILVGSSEKAKKILAWRPVFTNLEDIIRTAWHWEIHREKMRGTGPLLAEIRPVR